MSEKKSVENTTNRPERTRTERELTPPVDIFESAQDFLILVDLPGVDVDGVDVQLEPPELRLTGRIARVSRDAAPVAFTRSFRVDQSLDPDGVAAELKDGVLSVRLRKSSHFTPRNIPVKGG